MSKDVGSLVHGQQDQEYRNILDWLTADEYTNQHNDFMRERLLGTGQWFLGSEPFQRWLATAKQTLFCPGIPGAGKTIVSAAVIDHIQQTSRGDPAIRLAYVYCNFRRTAKQQAKDLLESLLRQLTTGWPSLPRAVQDLHEKHQKHSTRPTQEEILRTLHSVTAGCSRVFIVIDALDECERKSRFEMLDKLFDLQARNGINIMVTTRPNEDIFARFPKNCISKTICADEGDVQPYIEEHLRRMDTGILDDDLRLSIRSEVSVRSEGMCAKFL